MKKTILIVIILFGVGILTGSVISASLSWNLNPTGTETLSNESNNWTITLELPNGTMLYQGDQKAYEIPVVQLPEPITIPYNPPPIIKLPEQPVIELPPIVPIMAEYDMISDTLIIPDITDSVKYVDSQGNIWIPVQLGIVSGFGEIAYIDFEGGFYGIITDEGMCYDPINLPLEFQEDGLKISFKAIIMAGYVNFHMWGIMVDIIEIEAVN